MKLFTRLYQRLLNSLKAHRKLSTYIISALVPMVIILVVWSFIGMYPFGTKSLMAVDFGQQYISFYGFLKSAILSGDWSSFFYSFTKSLGGDMLGVLAYYLLSPFNLIYIITPFSHFSLAVFLTIWLRYGAIGLSFAYLLVRRYKALEGNAWLVPFASTAYALSGMLVSYQMNPIFYDAMILLPLVIAVLEELLDGGKPFCYIWMIALTFFLQFYMGYMIGIFVALYACFYVSPRLAVEGDWKKKLGSFFSPLLRTFSYSVMAIGLVSVLIYPVALNLMQSKGQVGTGLTFRLALQINPLDILSKLTIGGFDTTSGWSAGPNLPNIYVGALALFGFILYFKFAKVHRNQKISASIITVIFFISFVNEFASKIWHMGQNPAGFFFRFSWILSFYMVLLAFQAFKESPKISNKGFGIGCVILIASATYVLSQKYSYISKEQPQMVTDFVKQNYLLIFLFTGLFVTGIFYCYWKKWQYSKKNRLIFSVVLVSAMVLGLFLLQQGYLLSQVALTIMVWLSVLLVFYLGPGRLGWVMLTFITILELGYNAYLSQVTLHYANAYKFSDATISVKHVTDSLQDSAKTKFYRIGSSFSYSKTAPTLLSYPGLSSFSSSLERSTMNLFAYLGDVGVNAATQYANGTALTDALYGVRYYMDVKDFTQKEAEMNPKKMYFTRYSKRFDLPEYYINKVYDDDRYVVYENPNVLSIAFGTNTLVQNIQFGFNNPVANQNIILNSMVGNSKNDIHYFQTFGFSRVETENMKESTNDKGEKVYDRIDSNRPGIVRYKIIPKSSYTYYFLTPYFLNKAEGRLSILLNNKWLTNQKSFSQRQLWQLTSNTEGEETVLELRYSMDGVNLEGAGLVRADNDAIRRVLRERLKQNMVVTEWTNTTVKGTVDITDDSNIMMTTIPYSEGWTVKVDGRMVVAKKAWNSLLSFPITAGRHTIEMYFFPQGLIVGAVFSLVSLMIVVSLYYADKNCSNNENSQRDERKIIGKDSLDQIVC
ncbi:glycosyltransferase PgfM1 [Streptococcus ruminantium]|uniref:glycosyltransferase PgfM1 n=1 Tax=Streptococcus ruminantium TaxID=1917441 RepID=UPI0012DBD0DA|nr:YfhO family protein [Streptococcus ruminantium]